MWNFRTVDRIFSRFSLLVACIFAVSENFETVVDRIRAELKFYGPYSPIGVELCGE